MFDGIFEEMEEDLRDSNGGNGKRMAWSPRGVNLELIGDGIVSRRRRLRRGLEILGRLVLSF